MGVEVEVFHMLIERLNGVEDEIQRMRDDLGCILLPRLKDVTTDNVGHLKDKLREQDVVRALAARSVGRQEAAVLVGTLPENVVVQLKANGFRVKQAGAQRFQQDPTFMILWGDAECNAETLQHHWMTPDDFKDL